MIRLRAGLTAIAQAAAMLGGGLLMVAMLVTVFSVSRGLIGRPLLGDSEVVEMCMGVAVALCLPWAEMRGAHVIVDIFTNKLPTAALRWLEVLMHATTALVAIVLAARMIEGAFDQWDRERDTMFLQLPYWWGYAGAALALVLWSVTALFVTAERAAGIQRVRA